MIHVNRILAKRIEIYSLLVLWAKATTRVGRFCYPGKLSTKNVCSKTTSYRCSYNGETSQSMEVTE